MKTVDNPNRLEEKMVLALEMESGELFLNYRDSLEYSNNPLSKIYEREILRRLWIFQSVFPISQKEDDGKK